MVRSGWKGVAALAAATLACSQPNPTPSVTCGTGTTFDAASGACVAATASSSACGPNTMLVKGQCQVYLGGGGPTKWSANVQISPTTAQDGSALIAYEPQLAVSPPPTGGPDVYIIYPTFYGNNQSQVVVKVSHDGGQTFPDGLGITFESSDPTFGNPDHIGDPTIVASGSSALVAFVDYLTAGCLQQEPMCGNIYFSLTTDRGATWSPPAALVNGGSTTFIDRPFLSFGQDGFMYLDFTWDQPNESGQVVSDTHVVQYDISANPVTEKLFDHSLAGGAGFISQAPVVATAQGQIVGSLDANAGDTHVAVIVGAPNDDSQPFGKIAVRNSDQTRENQFRNLNQWVAANSSDQMLVWRWNLNGDTHIAASGTQGGVWDQNQLAGSVVDDAPMGVNCAYPIVTADERGGWHVLWQDNRYGVWGTYTSSSQDGQSWTPSSLASDQWSEESGPYDPTTGRLTAFLGDYDSIAAGGGMLYAAWVDTRNKQSQVFFSTAPNPLQ